MAASLAVAPPPSSAERFALPWLAVALNLLTAKAKRIVAVS